MSLIIAAWIQFEMPDLPVWLTSTYSFKDVCLCRRGSLSLSPAPSGRSCCALTSVIGAEAESPADECLVTLSQTNFFKVFFSSTGRI